MKDIQIKTKSGEVLATGKSNCDGDIITKYENENYLEVTHVWSKYALEKLGLVIEYLEPKKPIVWVLEPFEPMTKAEDQNYSYMFSRFLRSLEVNKQYKITVEETGPTM